MLTFMNLNCAFVRYCLLGTVFFLFRVNLLAQDSYEQSLINKEKDQIKITLKNVIHDIYDLKKSVVNDNILHLKNNAKLDMWNNIYANIEKTGNLKLIGDNKTVLTSQDTKIKSIKSIANDFSKWEVVVELTALFNNEDAFILKPVIDKFIFVKNVESGDYLLESFTENLKGSYNMVDKNKLRVSKCTVNLK